MTFGTNCYVVQDGKLTVGQRLTAGAFAGMSAVAVTHPLDVIRLRLSLPRAGYTGVSPAVFTSYYSASRCLLGVNLTMARALHHTLLMAGMTNALVTIMRTEGSFALYKGFAPALIGTAPFAALNFASYDLLKKYFFDLDVRFAPPPHSFPSSPETCNHCNGHSATVHGICWGHKEYQILPDLSHIFLTL